MTHKVSNAIKQRNQTKPTQRLIDIMVGWLDFFMAYSLCWLFNAKSTVLFQTIQFSISMQFKYKYCLIVKKTFLFQRIQSNQAVLIQLIQFCISTDFVYTQLNVKTVLYKTIQFCLSTVSMSKNSFISNNSV